MRPRVSALGRRVAYLTRIASVYARPSGGPLSFWYETPELNEAAFRTVGPYFMRFQGKARYAGPFDADGIPLLDYRGDIGRQYNPIAIAQYGLARYNQWCDGAGPADRSAWMGVARWLVRELRPNPRGIPVWSHHFDWPYRQTLRAPWYSGLAQGNGLSMLVRAARSSGDSSSAAAAHAAFEAFTHSVVDGGVICHDGRGDTWIEEYIVNPPTHILNGFLWALWGVYDYAQWTRSPAATELWHNCVATLERRLHEFDVGWWSLYEASNGGDRMLASRYYHTLHIVQLRGLHRLTGTPMFAARADRFEAFLGSPVYRARAFAEKAAFKLRNY